ncbi:MAG: hypothetical protein AABW41_02235 [Nanoarchaeota archaeon]
MNKFTIKDKWLILPIIILAAYFLFRVIDEFQMVSYFPIDNIANDYSGHMARLYFLKEYGFHNIVPNWFNGFPILKSYPFLWHFFALPFLYIFNNVQLATLMVFLITYLLILVVFFYIGKKENFSKAKVIALFLFLFANPITISYFLRLGKVVELFGWFFFFIIFLIFLHYKNKKIDGMFIFLFTIIYTALFYSHILVFIVATLPVLSFFLYKEGYSNRLKIALSGILTLLLTSYFWHPLLRTANQKSIGEITPLKWLVISRPEYFIDKIIGFALPIIFFTIFYLYLKSADDKKKEMLFYSIPLIFYILMFLRIAPFIPFINRPAPDSYNFMFLFFSIYMVLKIDFAFLGKKLIRARPYFLAIMAILFVISSIIITPFFIKPTNEVNDAIKLLDYIDENNKFLLINQPFNRGAFYTYAAIYKNLSTPDGWGDEEVDVSYEKILYSIQDSYNAGNCGKMHEANEKMDNDYFILFNNDCKNIKCDLKPKISLNTSCLVRLR